MTLKLPRLWVPVSAAVVALALVSFFVIAPGVSARNNVGAPVHAGVTNHTVSVGGHGEVNVAPDQATMTLGVQSKDSSAQTALADNASKMAAVIAAVEAQGIPASHVQTSDLSIWFDSEHNQYQVSHQITVRLDNVDRVGQTLDAAVAAGANNSWGVSFGLKDPSVARSQALQAAVGDARKRANSMASALGVSITGVGSASEASYQVQPPVPYAMGAVKAGAPQSTPVQPGQLSVTAEVNLVYTFG